MGQVLSTWLSLKNMATKNYAAHKRPVGVFLKIGQPFLDVFLASSLKYILASKHLIDLHTKSQVAILTIAQLLITF